MSRAAIVISVENTTEDGAKVTIVKADPGGEDAVNATHFSAPGVESRPLAGDTVALADAAGTGEEHAVGYADTGTTPEVGGGETRIYSRSAPGVVSAKIWLKSDGSIVISNVGGGSIEMAAGGNVTINGVVIDTSGNLSTPGDVTAVDTATPISLATHVHTSAAPSNPTSGPLPAPPPP